MISRRTKPSQSTPKSGHSRKGARHHPGDASKKAYCKHTARRLHTRGLAATHRQGSKRWGRRLTSVSYARRRALSGRTGASRGIVTEELLFSASCSPATSSISVLSARRLRVRTPSITAKSVSELKDDCSDKASRGRGGTRGTARTERISSSAGSSGSSTGNLVSMRKRALGRSKTRGLSAAFSGADRGRLSRA